MVIQSDWWSLFSAALGGGATLKCFELGFTEFKQWRVNRSQQSQSVIATLEPMLRATDELVGKLRSLAEQDFIPIRGRPLDGLEEPASASVIYLFVQFWSEVEIVRMQGLSSEVAKSIKGKQVQAFLNCLQSRRVRLIDRISQRALGEFARRNGKTMNFIEFMEACEESQTAKRWLAPLCSALHNLEATDGRQKLLQYTVVLHALIDTLDKEHLVTRNRPGTPNKLNKHSRRDLNYRVFGVYLNFVSDRQKYIGPLI